jgi:signal transduction histidine kinase
MSSSAGGAGEGQRWAQEQAALQRVATLVARGAPRPAVFASVAQEVACLFDAEWASVARYEPGSAVIVGRWSRAGDVEGTARLPLGGHNVTTLVHETRQPARMDSYASSDDAPSVRIARDFGIRSAVGAPIRLEGRLWGMLAVASTKEAGLPEGSENRLEVFARLVAAAIANAEARDELRRIAEEQAALRRLALLVARGMPSDAVLAAVAEEVAALFAADVTAIVRFEQNDHCTVVGGQGATRLGTGVRFALEQDPGLALLRDTGRTSRFDVHDPNRPTADERLSAESIVSAVNAPIVAHGRLWGAITVASRRHRLADDVEQQMADFAELVGTAIANAESQAALAVSRARVVATADETRRRIQRDLHDGAQQRLVSLTLQVRSLQAALTAEQVELRREIDRIAVNLTAAVDELRDLASGIHPPVLTKAGLRPALALLARRSPVPVDLDMARDERLPPHLEISAYYVVSEALANAAKHARASRIAVGATASDGTFTIVVRDDGMGGADFTGSGLIGLKDRVEALGGRISLQSPAGKGTTLQVELPLTSAGSDDRADSAAERA